MRKQDLKTGKEVLKEAAFDSSSTQESVVIQEGTDLSSLYDEWSRKILEEIEEFLDAGSSWTFESIVDLTINTVVYESLRGSSYIPLPEKLASKKAIINPKNRDNECFKWAVTRALNPTSCHAERIDKKLKEKAKELNWDGISFPTPLKDIDTFERNNSTISINVAGYSEIDQEHGIYKNEAHLLRTSNYEREHKVDLLLISNDENQHYCIIKNMSRLIYGQIHSKHQKRHHCRRCYQSFVSQESFEVHK